MVYLDNIIIYLNSKKEYKEYIKWVLKRLYKENIPIIVEKYKFYMSDYSTWCTNAYLRVRYTRLLFTRSVHQPPVYKALTNQGEAH